MATFTRLRKILSMRCVSDHAVRRNRTGANVVDQYAKPELQYERYESPAMSFVVLTTLIAVVCFIATTAAWTSA
jgi:hypothetical protein